MSKKPKLSILSPSFNGGKFLESMLESIHGQSFQDFEHIIIDGGSTDNTFEILKKYPRTRLITGKDTGYWDAFWKGLPLAQGEYIMQCCTSDGYLDMDWFRKCVDVFEKDPEVSVVWGLQQNMSEDDTLQDIIYRPFHKKDPPQKTEYFYYWLRSFACWPECNCMMRTNVWRECFPKYDYAKLNTVDCILEWTYQFHARGYLPYFIRSVANFARTHKGQLGQEDAKTGVKQRRATTHFSQIRDYRKKLLYGEVDYRFRDGKGNVLPYRFSRSKFLIKYVLSPKSIVNALFGMSANIIRKPLNAVLNKGETPSWLRDIIKKLKLFYAATQ